MAERILRTDDKAETKYNVTIFIDSMHGVTIPLNKFGAIVKDLEGKELGRFFAMDGVYDFFPAEEDALTHG